MKTIEQFVDFMESFLDERHQTQAYKTSQTTDIRNAIGAESPRIKKDIHHGLLASPMERTFRGIWKDNLKYLARDIQARKSQPANESSAHPGFKAVQNKVSKKY